MNRLALKLTELMNRWSGAAPAACCGACKPCVTQAATNLVVVAAGAGIEAAAARRSGDTPVDEAAPVPSVESGK